MNSTESESGVIINSTEDQLSLSACSVTGIYGLQNKLYPEKWYVGQSLDIPRRWDDYKKLRCKSQLKIYSAILKYGLDNFEKVIIENCSPDKLDEREIFWIKEYDCVNNGYNITKGGNRGGNRKGMKNSPEHNMKISLANKGKKKPPVSDETRQKLSLINKGRPGIIPSEETRLKLSLSHMGQSRPCSEATKQKLSQVLKKRM